MKKTFILCMAMILFAVLQAQTLIVRPGHVDAYQTIQEAINNCPDGGTVSVFPGVYPEELNWPNNRNITLTGRFVNNHPVIEYHNNAITFNNVNELNKIQRIKFKHANHDPVGGSNTSALILNNSNPEIINCIFEENYHAIKVNNNNYNNEVLIQNSIFKGNANRRSGVAIKFEQGSLKVIDSVFEHNVARQWYNPGELDSGNSGASIFFTGNSLYLENNTFSNNYGTRNGSNIDINNSYNEGFEANLTVINNKFINNMFDQVGLSNFIGVDLCVEEVSNFEKILIKNNIFTKEHPQIVSIAFGGNNATASNIKYYNNTNIGNSGNGSIELYNCEIDIKNSIFDGEIRKISNNQTNNSTISNSWFYYNNSIIGSFQTSNIYYGDPQIDPVTLAPIWTANTKSGLIDAGHIDTNGNGIIWYNDPDDQDPDGTRLDIGAVPAPEHGQFKHTLDSVGYNWVSFPYLDKLYTNSSYYIADQMHYMLHAYNNNMLFETELNRILEKVMWFDNSGYDETIHSSNTFYNTSRILDSRYGFKIQMLNNQPDKDIVTGGFLCGTYNNPDDLITIMAKEPGTQYREIWVGYFKETSEDPLYALQDIIGDLIEIKTRNWTMSRSMFESTWFKSTREPRLNQGEAVSLRYIGNNDVSFRWKVRNDIIVPKYIEPKTSHFTFTEQADYIPIFVELSDDMVSDDNAELGLFIDDVCYGAKVIKGNIVQINAYIQNAPVETGQVEFRYHAYDSKAPTKVINDYAVFQQNAQVYQVRNLDLSQNVHYHSVSFNKDKNEIETSPTISYLEGNYPNPFNPTTTIKYNIAQKEHIKLQIFNAKGQMIKELVNGEIEAGFHTAVWNGDDHIGNKVASGVYFYKLETSSHTEMRKMLLMK